MRILDAFRQSGRTMKRKLFFYMLALASVILVTLFAGLMLLGRFSSERQALADTLDLQMDFFEKEVRFRNEEAAVMGIELSREMTVLLEKNLADQGLGFGALRDNGDAISALQAALLQPLRQKLMRTDCSGAFVLLDTTVNSKTEWGDRSCSGLYLQKTSTSPSDETVLLYRGRPDVAKAAGIMPHRKWRLEFRSDLFSNFEECMACGDQPLERAYHLTNIFTLPGTSEQAVLLTVPLMGSDGTAYGVCGFEISQSSFKANHMQPTKLPHLSCLLTAEQGASLQLAEKLACGTTAGYFLAPSGPLQTERINDRLLDFSGESRSFVGLTREIGLTPSNSDFTLAVMIPKEDYRRAVLRSFLQMALLAVLLVFFTVSCCIYFSRRFLTPVLRSLDRLKQGSGEETGSSGLQEIDDLFGFLAERDQEHENALRTLEHEKEDAQSRALHIREEYERVESEYEAAQAEVARLAYSRTTETDPEAYQIFVQGIKTLTPAEQDIFRYYLEGRTVKEILEIAHIKESTLRYHNRNIYSKLGVSSLRQLLRFATLMQHETRPEP